MCFAFLRNGKEEDENLFLKKEQKRKHIKEEMWAIYFYYLKDNPMVGLKTRNNNNSVLCSAANVIFILSILPR